MFGIRTLVCNTLFFTLSFCFIQNCVCRNIFWSFFSFWTIKSCARKHHFYILKKKKLPDTLHYDLCIFFSPRHVWVMYGGNSTLQLSNTIGLNTLKIESIFRIIIKHPWNIWKIPSYSITFLKCYVQFAASSTYNIFSFSIFSVFILLYWTIVSFFHTWRHFAVYNIIFEGYLY